MSGELPFEKELALKRKEIEEMKRKMSILGLNSVDLPVIIAKLEDEVKTLMENTYAQLKPHEKMQIARHALRPTTSDLIEAMCTDFVELHGDRLYRDDLAIFGGIGKLDGIPVTLIGHQKGKDTKDNVARFFGMPHPEGFRKALRLMDQANKFKRPIITFIDTPGAYPGNAAEERGQGEAIARNLKAMASYGVPIICIVVGEGGSGGALALGVGNRVLMLEHAIYSVSSPEAAASILWKNAGESQRAAEAMKITAQDMMALGVIDDIIIEPLGGAHHDLQQTADSIKQAILMHLQPLLELTPAERIEDRFDKFRKLGAFKI
jgi:acetyl-CoA carboxylase carboxyl transferase subunit alpha